MIKRFFFQPGVALIILSAVCLFLPACAGAEPDHQGRRVGGPCQYKSYPGRATILSMTSRPADDSDRVRRFDVKFSFTPAEKIEESFAGVEGRSFLLYGNNFSYPDEEFLTRHNIHAGRVLDGTLLVIISGTCTPLLFDFPTLSDGK